MSSPAHEAISTLSDAFRERDIDAALACFSDHAGTTYVGSEAGEVAVGKAALRHLLEAVFARNECYSWQPGVVWSQDAGTCQIVMAELVLRVHQLDGADASEGFPYRLTGVLADENGRWRWRLCHGSEPAA